MVRRVAPPPSDEQLAAAEQTDNRRRRDRIAAIEDQQEQERLALAGEPESEQRVALRASASVLDSRPAEVEDTVDVSTANGSAPSPEPAPATRTRKPRQPKPAVVRAAKAPTRGRDPIPTEERGPAEDDEDQEARQARNDEKLAYRLMDTAYKKWEKNARKDLTKANRELAFDLGKDTALYLRAGIIRMADIHATIEKLTATAKQGKDSTDGDENYDDQLAEMRAALRGE